ncbi:hypothetical protein A9G11_09610 [Gilliamella sp. wkB108]|uniref:flavodoxin n=1 Tax=Gilliamella sp. wkB108 TaxID=3120256 RepID=UPI00080E77E3|nr:flavodoxin [Gilliamella apicola]OCG20940.1 hypothetical protein A9G11_09610 [Gilliamella apicola]
MNTFSRRHFIKTVVAGLTGICAYYCVSNHKVYAQSSSIPTNNKHILVIYYSLPESDSNLNEHRENSTVTIDNQLLGNTQYMAMIIQAALKNTDIFRIETVTPYDTTDHAKLIEQAKNELNNNYRPALKQINNLDQYDTILFGYPIWWADLPTPVYSFLSQNDFAGKKVIPFGTHGGSGFANTRTTIAKLQPNADFRGQNGLTIYRDRIDNAKNEIVDWVNQLSLV